jgi:hypothetical protein
LFVKEASLLSTKGPVRAGSLIGQETLLGYAGVARLASMGISGLRYRSHNSQVIRVVTEQGHRVTTTPDHQFLVQLKPSNVFYDVFLVLREGMGYVLGVGHGQLRDLSESTVLYERQLEDKPSVVEKIWMISSHKNLAQASYIEQLLSIRYGLPVFAIDPRLRRHGLSQELVERLLTEVDTHSRAERLLKDALLSPQLPHFKRKLLTSQDQARLHYLDGILYEPLEQRYKGTGTHRHVIRIVPFSDGVRFDRDRIRYLGAGEVRTEVFERQQDLERRLNAHLRDAFTDTQRRVVLPLRRPFFMWPASYLREGMILPTYDGSRYHEDTITQITNVDHRGDVVEVELEGSCQLVAGGIVVGTGVEPISLPL